MIDRKSYQWLGATVASSRDNDLVVVSKNNKKNQLMDLNNLITIYNIDLSYFNFYYVSDLSDKLT